MTVLVFYICQVTPRKMTNFLRLNYIFYDLHKLTFMHKWCWFCFDIAKSKLKRRKQKFLLRYRKSL